MGAVFSHLDDIWSLVQSTEVCRLWWLEGHHRVWRKIQLRDLTGYVKDLSRRQYFASFVEELAFEPDDTILADARMSIPLLDFKRLSSVKLYGSNLDGARTGNIMSLIVPSLRSWTIKESDVSRKANHDQDDITAMSALLTGAATLRSMRIDMDCSHTLGPVVYQMLDVLTAVEHLHMGLLCEILLEINPPEDFLRKMLGHKPNLATVSFPYGTDFYEAEIDSFLAQMGPDWSMSSLGSFSSPTFRSCPAGLKVISRMPNLEQLFLTVRDVQGTWGDGLKHIFTFLPSLRQLQTLDLEFSGENCDFDGSLLVELGKLQDLDTLRLEIFMPGVISITAAQLACFLTSLSKLKYLLLKLHKVVIPCTADERMIIHNALAEIPEVDLGGIIFTRPSL